MSHLSPLPPAASPLASIKFEGGGTINVGGQTFTAPTKTVIESRSRIVLSSSSLHDAGESSSQLPLVPLIPAASPPPPLIYPRTTDWLIIGGGPLGTIAVAVLLNQGVKDILWIDPSFERMGRLGERYGGVPANTRNDRLVRLLHKLHPAVDFGTNQARRRAANKTAALLIDAPPLGVAPLTLSIDALRDASYALRHDSRVRAYRGVVTALDDTTNMHKPQMMWNATLQLEARLADPSVVLSSLASATHVESVRARFVLLATGAAPRKPPAALLSALATLAPRVRVLPHDDAVNPDRLRARLVASAAPTTAAATDTKGGHPLRNASFAIVGGAHSGTLAAMHVLSLCGASAVHVYHRGAVKLAEERGSWIKYDGTGLKGVARAWARAQQRIAAASATGDPQPPPEATDDSCTALPEGQASAADIDAEPVAHPDDADALAGVPHDTHAGLWDAASLRKVHVHTDAPPDTGNAAADAQLLAERIAASGATWLVWTTGFARQAVPPPPADGYAASVRRQLIARGAMEAGVADDDRTHDDDANNHDDGGRAAASEVGLPRIVSKGEELDLAHATHDMEATMALSTPDGARRLEGLYGLGIGFPAVEIDPEGAREPWVGFGSDAIKLVEAILHDAGSRDGERRDEESSTSR